MDSKYYWEDIYSKENSILYDGWLNKYLDIIKNKTVINLGGGNGVNALFLFQNNVDAIVCDFSKNALKQLNIINPKIKTMFLDIRNNLPFKNETIDIFLLDLSLHYFNNETTIKIIEELYNKLKDNGMILCRVNSIKELKNEKIINKIEDNFYLTQSGEKRFFSKENIEKFFKDYDITYIQEGITNKYLFNKHLWEFSAVKTKKEQ